MKQLQPRRGFAYNLKQETNILALDKKPDYFYQVHCVMYCSGRQWYNIVVQALNLHIEKICYD